MYTAIETTKLFAFRKGKLPIVTPSGLLVAMVSRTDIKKNVEFPHATKALNNSLKGGGLVRQLKLLDTMGRSLEKLKNKQNQV